MFRYTESGPLLADIAGVDNLTQAWLRVRSNIQVARRSRSRGSDEVSIADFEADWTHQMETLAEELLTGRYQPLPPRQLLLPKRDGGQRVIAILAVRDRVAQRAVQQVLEPLFDPTFLDCSYGSRPHVGAPHALARVDRYRQQGYRWAAHADIATFFDTIDHRVLLGLLRLRIRERAVLDLIDLWLQAGVLAPEDDGDASAWWHPGTAVTPPRPEPYTPLAAAPNGYPYGAADPGAGQAAWLGDAPPVPSRPRQIMETVGDTAQQMASFVRPVLSSAPVATSVLRGLGANPFVALAGVAAVAGGGLAFWLAHRERGRGTVQGGALSPLLANLYLDPFDRALTRQGHTLVRYVDDFLLLGRSRAEVEAGVAEARRQVVRLRLQLNEAKTAIYPPEAAPVFLGQRFAPLVAPPSPRYTSFQEAGARMDRMLQRGGQTVRRLRK